MPDRNQSYVYTIRFIYQGDEYNITKEASNPTIAQNYILVNYPGARKVMIVNRVRKSELMEVNK